jgi:predicted nucleotidyltransferase component of viral defense system
MIALRELEKYYPEDIRNFKRFIIREYLQCKILQIIYNTEYALKLNFPGGTCLRIVLGNNRFSEDLDFDNFGLIEKQDFDNLSDIIRKELEKEGYQVEIKNVFKGAFHCIIRFPGLLFEEGLSGFKEEKILIQLDSEPQHFSFIPNGYILNRFDIFTEIKVTPEDILLAQKFYAIYNRKRNKGRDFFDVAFLLSLNIKPNYNYLKLKMNVQTENELKEKILEKCTDIDMEEMAKDVAPFLFYEKGIKRVLLFPKLLKQASL